jgi:hypothetical protein
MDRLAGMAQGLFGADSGAVAALGQQSGPHIPRGFGAWEWLESFGI